MTVNNYRERLGRKIPTSYHLPLSTIFNIECISSVKVSHTESYQSISVTNFKWPDASEDDIKLYHDLSRLRYCLLLYVYYVRIVSVVLQIT